MAENVAKKLTPKQRQAISALLAGHNYRRAALEAGVAERTLARWRQSPEFDAALADATDAALGDASRRLAALLDTAISAVGMLLTARETPDHIRLRAAAVVIDSALRLVELHALAERVKALEDRLL